MWGARGSLFWEQRGEGLVRLGLGSIAFGDGVLDFDCSVAVVLADLSDEFGFISDLDEGGVFGFLGCDDQITDLHLAQVIEGDGRFGEHRGELDAGLVEVLADPVFGGVVVDASADGEPTL